MKGLVPNERPRIYLIGVRVVCGLAVLFALVLSMGMWPRPTVPSTNLYFRPGDPAPLPFPTIRSGMKFGELERNQQGGKKFEVGFEWHPESGPFDDIKAEFAPEGLVAAQYHIRPQYLRDFRSSLHAAFADHDRELGPNQGDETLPDVHGYWLSFKDGVYSVNPLDPDDVAAFRFTKALKQGLIVFVALFFLYLIVFPRSMGRFIRT